MRRAVKVCFFILVFTTVVISLYSRGAKEEKLNLRIASPSEGPEQIEIYDALMAEFEETHPGVTVTWDRSTGDDYQFQGLPSLLESDTPPDIYFEWGGYRVLSHARDGYAMDITSLANELKPSIDASAWSGAEFDGKIYMMPTNHDITIMMWYNVDIFDRLGIEVPVSWSGFLDVCAKLKSNGVLPVVMGNADAWVAGNFAGNFLYRWAGDKKTDDILSLKPGTSFEDPDFIKALQFADELGEKGYVNEDLNTLGYEESFTRMFDGSAAMYPLGTWYVTEVIPELAPDPTKVNHSFFNLPPFKGGKGDPNSFMGLNTGFVVNAKTSQKELAFNFIRLMMSKKYQSQLAALGSFQTVKGTADESNPYVRTVLELLDNTSTVVSPPDTGYNLEMAAALYQAIAKVLVNAETPQDALAAVEAKVKHLRK